MAKDVNIHIKTPGAAEAKQQLDNVSQSTEKIGTEGHRAGTGLGKLKDSILSWITALAGVGAIINGITRAIRTQMDAIKEHGRIAAEQQKKLTMLQYLGEFFKEKPELRKEVEAYAVYGRRPFEEVAESWYTLRSKGAGLTRQQQQDILKESLELGRTVPETNLNTLVDMFSLYAKKTGEKDANRIQNVLLKTIEEAGGTAEDVGRYMPEFLPVGMSGGLSGAQSAGLWAYVTTQLASPSTATTGLRATFMGLQGRGTPESQKLLGRLGVDAGEGFLQKINILSEKQKAGQFGLSEAELLAGREGASVLLSMLKSPAAMMKTVGSVVGADVGSKDLTQKMITELLGKDEMAALEDKARKLAVSIQNIKGSDTQSMQWGVYLLAYEEALRKQRVPEWLIKQQLYIEGVKSAVGLEPGQLSGIASPILSAAEMQGVRRQTQPVINNHYHNEVQYYPTTDRRDINQPRVGRDTP
ncbi:MAG: phage tail tape measure protein [Candidatus Marinimicrobia bacterium]|jgi:hypothetical protein|nr:phage tail tape measure protein [Candidatus Neomarinimicrobiota bacterium]